MFSAYLLSTGILGESSAVDFEFFKEHLLEGYQETFPLSPQDKVFIFIFIFVFIFVFHFHFHFLFSILEIFFIYICIYTGVAGQVCASAAVLLLSVLQASCVGEREWRRNRPARHGCIHTQRCAVVSSGITFISLFLFIFLLPPFLLSCFKSS